MRKLLAILWMGVTVVVAVFAVAGLSYHTGFFDIFWEDPFARWGQNYIHFIDRLFEPVDRLTNNAFGWVAPFGVLHAVVAYFSIASAVLAWRWAEAKEPGWKSTLKTAASSLAWIVTIPANAMRSSQGEQIQAATAYMFGLAGLFGAANWANANLANDVPESEYVSVEEMCAGILSSDHRKRPYLQHNFDRAIDAKRWDDASDTAGTMVDLTRCLGGRFGALDQARYHAGLSEDPYDAHQANIDEIRINLNAAGDFYKNEQWWEASEFYRNGIMSYDQIQRPITYSSDPNDTGIHGKSAEFSILFNPKVIYFRRLQQLTTIKNLFGSEPASAFYLTDIDNAISEFRKTREVYPADLDEDDEKPLIKWLKKEGLAAVDNLVEDAIPVAARQLEYEDQIRAGQNLNILLNELDAFDYLPSKPPAIGFGIIPSYPSASVAARWLEIERKITTTKSGTELTASEFVITHRITQHILSEKLNPNERETDLSSLELLRGLETTHNLVKSVESLPFEAPADLLRFRPIYPIANEYSMALPIPVAMIDPYVSYIAYASRLNKSAEVEKALESHTYYNLIHILKMNEDTYPYTFTREDRIYALGGSTAELIGKSKNLDRDAVILSLDDPNGANFESLEQELDTLSNQMCSRLRGAGWTFPGQTCEDFVKKLLLEGLRSDPPEIIIVQAGAYSASLPYVTIELMFGTTRAYEPDSLSPETRFTRKDDPNGNGWRGTMTLRAPRHLLGPPLLADAFTKGEERAAYFRIFGDPVIFGFGPKAEAEFKAELNKRLAEANSNDVLIYVHGVGNSFAQAAKRTAQLSYDLTFPGSSTFYSWPTEDNFLGYFKDIDVPQMAIDDLANFVKDAADTAAIVCAGIQDCKPGKVNIIAHSHGAKVTIEALKKMIGDLGTDDSIALGQIILAAPDVNGKKLKKAVDEKLSKISERVTIYTNSSDRALWASSLLNFFKLRGGLGKSGGTCEAQLIDASSAVPFGSHSYFARESEVIADIRTLIWHRAFAPTERCYLQEKQKNSRAAWKFAKENCDITAYDLASQIAIRQRSESDVDFNTVFAELIGEKDIADATQMKAGNDDSWTMIGTINATTGEPTITRVPSRRYDKTVEYYTDFVSGKTGNGGITCAP